MAKLIVKLKILVIKKKRGRPTKANNANKRNKKSQVFDFYLIFSNIFYKSKKIFFSHITQKP